MTNYYNREIDEGGLYFYKKINLKVYMIENINSMVEARILKKNNFRLVTCLGQGSFGKVYKV